MGNRLCKRPPPKGTFVAVRLSDKSILDLSAWWIETGIGLPLVKDPHVTLISSSKPIAIATLLASRPAKYVVLSEVVTIDQWQQFDKKWCLVLQLKTQVFDWRYKDLVAAGGVSRHPNFRPHMSLVMGIEGPVDLEKLPSRIPFDLVFDHEYNEEQRQY
jgi:hypothetical protein